jgi:hypothetical protein
MIAPVFLLVPGTDDLVEFGKLPDVLKSEFDLWENVMKRLFASERPAREIKIVAHEMRGVLGFSAESIERKYYAVKNGGSWRVLVNRNKLTGRRADSGMTAAVVQAWHETLARHQRKCKPAYREILRRYRAGETIGDVGWQKVWKQRHPHTELPSACPPDMPLPDGWSYDSFMRKQPKRADLVAVRIGEKAAQQYRYQVHTTRNGIHVGEAYVFDDMWHDLKLNFVGQTASVRPLELGGADVFSGYKFDPGFRPRRERQDGTRDGLGERDMRLYLAHVLCNIGYYKGGCTLYVEHGTAAIAKHLDAVLDKFSGGMIKVQRSGIEGVKQYAQLYSGKGAGNPRLKAGYESLHNLVHNEVDALPAQTGMDRAHTPESLYGRDAINTKLLVACYALTPARASLLRFPVMEWGVGIDAIMHAYYNMNRRTDHELEGWITAKLVKHQFRLGPAFPWQDHRELDLLDDAHRGAVEAIITLPDYHQIIRMSPFDVWSAGQTDLVKLPLHVLPLICGEDLSTVRTCPPSDQIDFMDISVSPDPMYFETRVTTAEGFDKRLQEGREYRWLINPFDSRQCFVSETNGSYLGTARRCNVPCKTDADALHREMGVAAKHEKEAALRLTAMNRPEIKRRIAEAEHNAALMNGDPMLAEEIAELNDRKARHAATEGDYRDLASTLVRAPGSADSAYGVSMDELRDL